jgi:hypothetical protein
MADREHSKSFDDAAVSRPSRPQATDRYFDAIEYAIEHHI